MGRDVNGDHRGTKSGGAKRVSGVHRADHDALLIAQYRRVECPRDMVKRELGRRAHIHNLVKRRQVCYVRVPNSQVMQSMSIKLTQLSHGGGCGCKIGPSLLQDMLRALPLPLPDANLLVGSETSDDAAVYRLNDHQALVATTDFFMPIVDDPFDFGRIAATNAISDIYAMGGKPILGLAIVGMPIERLPVEVIAQICQAARVWRVTPVSRSAAATRSTLPSRSTDSRCWVWSIQMPSSEIAMPARVTCWC